MCSALSFEISSFPWEVVRGIGFCSWDNRGSVFHDYFVSEVWYQAMLTGTIFGFPRPTQGSEITSFHRTTRYQRLSSAGFWHRSSDNLDTSHRVTHSQWEYSAQFLSRPPPVTHSGMWKDWRRLTLFGLLTIPGSRACWPRLWGHWRHAGCLVAGLIYHPGSQ